ncbi:MAG: metalloregulator ArsR/SmtB family transcription factor [Myxococcota bacterium]
MVAPLDLPASLRLIARPRAQEILRLVWDQELAAGEIAGQFDVTFGAVSQHLRRLREAGLVSMRRVGRSRRYRARKAALGPLAAALEALWAERLERVRVLAEQAEASR